MVDETHVRNSRSLAVFTEIVHGPTETWRAVEIAGRGIAAEARCELSMPVKSMEPNDRPLNQATRDTIAFADRVEILLAIEDDLVSLWRTRRQNELDDPVFEAALEQLVARLEAWPHAVPQAA